MYDSSSSYWLIFQIWNQIQIFRNILFIQKPSHGRLGDPNELVTNIEIEMSLFNILVSFCRIVSAATTGRHENNLLVK